MANEIKESLDIPRAVMVIDDEEFMIEVISEVLRDVGVPSVLAASDGRDALAKLAALSRQPDLLVCDLCMPGMDGIAFLRNICEQGYRGDIILFSGLDASVLKAAEQLARSYSASLLGVLGKPLDRQALIALVGRHAQRDPQAVARQTGQPLSEPEIRAALANDGIVVCFQPKVLVQNGKVVGTECLARLRHPERGVLGPEMFIASAEQCGLIDELTLVVFRKAVAQASVWQAQAGPIKVAVNLSMESMSRLDLPDILAGMADAEGINPASIILEVTESKLPQNFVVSLDILTRLRIKGFNLSIDDFGTGYSSLESLKQLPFTELKIDRAFVSGAHRDASSRAILESSARLGKQLKLNLVAEGVETQEEWDFVAQVGCHEVQGFLVGKPMSADDFAVWRRQWESALPRPGGKSGPASAAGERAAETREAREVAAPAPLDEAGKPLALVVDDEEFGLELVREALHGICRVATVLDGAAALAFIAAERPAIVIVDVEMPLMDGYETCRRIRQQRTLAGLPILFLSAKDSIDDRLNGYEAGGDDYMTKPFEQRVLKAKVSNLLSLAEERRQLRESANSASTTAITAMTSMSEMGLVLEALRQFNASTTYRELAEAVLQGIGRFGLDGSVQLRAPGCTLTLTSAGPASPLDVSIIEHVQNMDRIVQFKTRVSISHEAFTLLVQNMPDDDAERCGRLRDHLDVLAEAAEVRLLCIAAALQAYERGNIIDSTIRRISRALLDIDESQRQSRLATALEVNAVIETMERALVSSVLSDAQEAHLLAVVRQGLDRIAGTPAVEVDIRNQLSSIVKELKTSLHGA